MVRRLNHAVLFVRDAATSAAFYQDVLGMEIAHQMGDGAIFLASPRSGNDHDLGLFSIGGEDEPRLRTRRPGLYHLAWEVDTLGELAEVRHRLTENGALTGASNHGASRSLYATDPDGLEFEVMWEVPADRLDPDIDEFGVFPLDLDADIARFGADLTRNQ